MLVRLVGRWRLLRMVPCAEEHVAGRACFRPAGYSSSCFLTKTHRMPNCECYQTCKSCGYGTNPTWPSSCTSCKTGLHMTSFFGNGTGACIGPAGAPQCFSAPGSPPVPNCHCHESCMSCGYGDLPNSPNDCIACQPGRVHHKLFADGSGTCLNPSGESRLPCTAQGMFSVLLYGTLSSNMHSLAGSYGYWNGGCVVANHTHRSLM
jgi:hypothetical protein